MDELAVIVGDRVRSARLDRELSLADLAAQAGIGKGSLSELENGMRNPTLSTLHSLANALECPLASLLAEPPGDRIASPGVEARLLDVTRNSSGTVEVYRLHLDVGARHRSAGHPRDVIEHIAIIDGYARVGRLRSQVELGPGDTASWRSDVTHSYAALGDDPVESVLVVHYPSD